ncbi:ROK family protein [Edaphobacter albus]|uniref:ROK family protein n=1 Tax=Edaphobacter sp. 4G125 TaxID=2763071 RepID=UPI001646A186|nr:ROK family protein [Edaphobacter sp. 4G125]QNI38179.1 ROK family protein [Edaphobacter sp. 4G125]
MSSPTISTNDKVLLSFDMGGSHVAAMAVDISNPLSRSSASLALDEGGSATYLLDRAAEAGRMALSALTLSGNIAGIAVAIPGPFDYPGGVSRLQHKFSAWYGLNIRKCLADQFGLDGTKIIFLNDADAFLLGELQEPFAARAIGITLGTGIGAAFAIDGRPVSVTDVLPNDLYALPWRDRTVEDFVSTRGIMKLQEDRGGKYQSVKEITKNSFTDPIASEIMSAFGDELGRVIEVYLLPLAPDIIVLGGSISRSSETFLPSVLSGKDHLTNLLKISSHFEKAALRGSIVAWFRQQTESI